LVQSRKNDHTDEKDAHKDDVDQNDSRSYHHLYCYFYLPLYLGYCNVFILILPNIVFKSQNQRWYSEEDLDLLYDVWGLEKVDIHHLMKFLYPER
jgi:hypothetical protein